MLSLLGILHYSFGVYTTIWSTVAGILVLQRRCISLRPKDSWWTVLIQSYKIYLIYHVVIKQGLNQLQSPVPGQIFKDLSQENGKGSDN